MPEGAYDKTFEVNTKGYFFMAQKAGAIMVEQQSGSIINIASIAGIRGSQMMSHYAASKAGIIGFTKSVAKELGSRNIRCNAIAPGFILTEMTENLPADIKSEWISKIPLKRGGTPEDVANTALFLASELSSYISGQTIHVCGGMLT